MRLTPNSAISSIDEQEYHWYTVNMEKKMYPKLTIRLFTDQKCFGPGVATLMHRVEEHHSLRAAAISMDMAYSKAWTVMKNAEAGFGFKLLHSTTGGRGGGGAVLTAEGKALLAAYDSYVEKLTAEAEALFPLHFEKLLS